jgi:hypothetical protein
MSLRSLTSRPVTGIPNGPRPPPGWFPEPEDARPSAPGSNPGRAGRALTIRGGNGSHTPRPGVQIRAAASVRSESSRNGIAPGPTTLVSVPSREAPHHPRSSLRGVGRARRRGLSARGTRGLRAPYPLRVTGPSPRKAGPLGGRNLTGPTERRVAAVAIARQKRGLPAQVHRGLHQTRVGDVSDAVDLRLRRGGPHPGANPAGHSPRPQPNRETSRGVSLAGRHLEGSPPHLVSGRAGQGCRSVCWRVLMALAGRARHLAERIVDGLELFAPRGPRFPAGGRGKGADPRAPLPERSGVVFRTTL